MLSTGTGEVQSGAGSAGLSTGAGSSNAEAGGAHAGGASGGSGGSAAGGGAPNGGSAGSAAGGASGYSVCNFASGANVAWVNFANDVPNPNISAFRAIFQGTRTNGGRVIRWWFHTNGTVTPGYDSSGNAKNLQQSHIDGLKAILNEAQADKVSIVISLWSFDMLQANAGNAHTNNSALLTQDSNRQAYIDNYLVPLVNAIKGHPALYAWEIFNEPEGMGPSGWATYRVSTAAIQKTVNWFADAIHNTDPVALVTNGTQVFGANSNVGGGTNYYSDSALRAAGGRQKGTLDFYEVHYYTSNGAGNSCFTHPASYWGLDKKVVMGEFYAADTDGVARADTYTHLYNNGYNGAWAWVYGPDVNLPMQNLYNAHAATIDQCPQ